MVRRSGVLRKRQLYRQPFKSETPREDICILTLYSIGQCHCEHYLESRNHSLQSIPQTWNVEQGRRFEHQAHYRSQHRLKYCIRTFLDAENVFRLQFIRHCPLIQYLHTRVTRQDDLANHRRPRQHGLHRWQGAGI